MKRFVSLIAFVLIFAGVAVVPAYANEGPSAGGDNVPPFTGHWEMTDPPNATRVFVDVSAGEVTPGVLTPIGLANIAPVEFFVKSFDFGINDLSTSACNPNVVDTQGKGTALAVWNDGFGLLLTATPSLTGIPMRCMTHPPTSWPFNFTPTFSWNPGTPDSLASQFGLSPVTFTRAGSG